MSDELDPWFRRHFQSSGGTAFLFYVVYGRTNYPVSLSRTGYRVQQMPPGLKVMNYDLAGHPDTVRSFREGYVWDRLVKSHPAFAETIESQTSCTILRGEFADAESLNYLRDTIGIVTHLIDHGGVGVYDPQMFHWWVPEEWKRRVFDPAGPVPRHHTVILVSDDGEGTEWIHTRGMRKFGRPDLSLRHVSAEWKDGAIDLCNRFIEFQALGGTIAEASKSGCLQSLKACGAITAVISKIPTLTTFMSRSTDKEVASFRREYQGSTKK